MTTCTMNAELADSGLKWWLEIRPVSDKTTLEADDMIERIAVAMWHRFGSPHQCEWADETHKAEFRDAAKSVVKAMREPSRAMWAHAGTMFINCQGRDLHHDRACGLVWDAMLAAALEPELANG